MFDIFAPCSVLQHAKLPSVTHDSLLLPGPTLVAETLLQMPQTSCATSTRPLTVWVMQSLNLQGQRLLLVLTVLLTEGRWRWRGGE